MSLSSGIKGALLIQLFEPDNQTGTESPMPVDPHTPPIVLCHLSGQLSAWQLMLSPVPLLIHSEEQVAASTSDELNSACHDIANRLYGEIQEPSLIHWITNDQQCASLAFLPKLRKIFPSAEIQLLNWPWLVRRLGINTELDINHNSDLHRALEYHIMPWLIEIEEYAVHRTQQQQQLQSEYDDQEKHLAIERQRLQRENERLQRENAALQKVDAEALLHYLPALFPQVFNVLGATDLALLCHQIEPFNLPNPYREPTKATLRKLQWDFRNLPKEKQRQIIQFIEPLPQRKDLTPRPEMRELIADIQGELICA